MFDIRHDAVAKYIPYRVQSHLESNIHFSTTHMQPHISVKADTIFDLFGILITNSMLLSWVALAVLVLVGTYYQAQITRKRKSTFFYFLHTIFSGVYNFLSSILHEKTKVLFPLLSAYFFYILINNWVGLMPSVGSILVRPVVSGAVHASSTEHEFSPAKNDAMNADPALEPHTATVSESEAPNAHTETHLLPLFRANNADLNTTFALALITVSLIQYYGVKFNGVRGYLKKFFNFSSPILFFVGILELIAEFSRILSFAFRLFGNVLAGEVLITIVAFLLPSVFSFFLVPFYVLEMMASTIQALVFTMISAVLLNMATTKAHH